MTDIPNMSERELLVQHGEILKKLCGSITALKKENGVEHKNIGDKVDEVVTTKISNKLFFWLVGLMIIAQIGLVTFVGDLNTQVTTNKTHIEHVEHEINRIGNNR